jgi:L-lactate dehydrogenase complex protein LldG
VSARDEILARVRRNQPAPAVLPPIPAFATGGSLRERFKAGVERMGGRLVEAPARASLEALIRELHPEARVVCSAVAEVKGDRRPDPERPAALEDVDVGVVRAVFGVAETGSVWLTAEQFGAPALGFLSQHLVVLLDPARILGNMHDAYRERAQFDAGYGVFMTGPSATADIEGVLIHGAQGIRSLTIVLDPRRA